MLQRGMTNHATLVRFPDEGARIEPDTLLPDQLRPPLPSLAGRPERRLISAILEHAVAEYQRYALATDIRGRRLFDETDEWFRSNDEMSPFTFLSICQALGLEATWVRGGLRRWLERERQAHLGARLSARRM